MEGIFKAAQLIFYLVGIVFMLTDIADTIRAKQDAKHIAEIMIMHHKNKDDENNNKD